MSDLVLIGVYESIAAVEQAITSLQRAGFPERQISVIAQEGRFGRGEWPLRPGIHPGIGIDAAIGGVLGYLYGGAILRARGLGPMLVAGPVTVELGRTMEKQETEPGEGEWLAPWAGLGLTPNEIRAYEFALRDHLNLVVAQGSREEIERARIALGTVGAERLARHALAFPAPGTYATQLLR